MAKKKNIAYEIDKSVTRYFEEISKFSSLTRDEELSLWRKYKNDKDMNARDKLISSNLKFVASVAKKYKGLGLSYADLIAEGNIGLLKAIEKYDGEKGFKAISYSVWWIRQSILEALNKKNLIGTDDLPTDREQQPNEDDIYTDTALQNTEDTFIDSEDSMHEKEINEAICIMMDCLSERERKIVSQYYGLENGKSKTLEEIGNGLGLTKERVRQINEKALKKLRVSALNNCVTSDIYS